MVFIFLMRYSYHWYLWDLYNNKHCVNLKRSTQTLSVGTLASRKPRTSYHELLSTSMITVSRSAVRCPRTCCDRSSTQTSPRHVVDRTPIICQSPFYRNQSLIGRDQLSVSAIGIDLGQSLNLSLLVDESNPQARGCGRTVTNPRSFYSDNASEVCGWTRLKDNKPVQTLRLLYLTTKWDRRLTTTYSTC